MGRNDNKSACGGGVRDMTNKKLTAVLFVAAALMCLYGAYSGETETVYQKAANICMECIGIG